MVHQDGDQPTLTEHLLCIHSFWGFSHHAQLPTPVPLPPLSPGRGVGQRPPRDLHTVGVGQWQRSGCRPRPLLGGAWPGAPLTGRLKNDRCGGRPERIKPEERLVSIISGTACPLEPGLGAAVSQAALGEVAFRSRSALLHWGYPLRNRPPGHLLGEAWGLQGPLPLGGCQLCPRRGRWV